MGRIGVRWAVLAVGVAVVLAGTVAVFARDDDGATTEGGCEAARRAPVEPGAQTLRYGGRDRDYRLALPEGSGDRSGHPLVLNLHGFSSNMDKHDANASVGAEGAARGYIVVTPQALGLPRRWNIAAAEDQPDDFGFLHALVADLSGRLCVDPHRVYAAGVSNGAAAAAQLVCQPPYSFAAVAMVSATVPAECPPEHPVSVLAIHGTADPQVPYNGGKVGGEGLTVPPAPKVVEWYAQRYGCATPPVRDEPVPGVQRVRHAGCRGGEEVVLDTVVGGRHEWPGSKAALGDSAVTGAGKTFSATTAILDFFDTHPAR